MEAAGNLRAAQYQHIPGDVCHSDAACLSGAGVAGGGDQSGIDQPHFCLVFPAAAEGGGIVQFGALQCGGGIGGLAAAAE